MRLKITSLALLLAAFAGPAAAIQSPYHLRVNPYPVPYPFFDGQSNNEHVVLSLSYVGSTVDQSNAAKLNLNGALIGVNYRRAIDDNLAWDALLGIAPEIGSVNSGSAANTHTYSMTVVSVPLATDVEYQAYKNQMLSVLVFGGPHFDIVSSQFEDYGPGNFVANGTNPTGTGTNTWGTTSMIYGFQFGAQVGIETGFAKFAPFFMLSPEWGNYSAKYYSYAQNDTVRQSGSLPTSMMTTLGTQVWLGQGFGLSVASQAAPAYKKNNTTYQGFRNLLVNLHFSF